MLYEIKLKVTKPNDKGEAKEVREHYLTDCELFAEAEYMGAQLYPNSDVDVFAVFRSDIREIVNQREDGKYVYKAIVYDIFTNDKGEEKELKYPMLIFADDLNTAVAKMDEYLKQGYDMRLDSLRRVKITDILLPQ